MGRKEPIGPVLVISYEIVGRKVQGKGLGPPVISKFGSVEGGLVGDAVMRTLLKKAPCTYHGYALADKGRNQLPEKLRPDSCVTSRAPIVFFPSHRPQAMMGLSVCVALRQQAVHHEAGPGYRTVEQ